MVKLLKRLGVGAYRNFRATFAGTYGMVAVSLSVLIAGVLSTFNASAFAQSYTVSSAQADVGTFIGGNFASVATLILAVAGAVLALVVLMWGIKWVLGLFSGRRTRLS